MSFEGLSESLNKTLSFWAKYISLKLYPTAIKRGQLIRKASGSGSWVFCLVTTMPDRVSNPVRIPTRCKSHFNKPCIGYIDMDTNLIQTSSVTINYTFLFTEYRNLQKGKKNIRG